jgi:leader peptidase (prepilin peptidase) / N-methyltransferase
LLELGAAPSVGVVQPWRVVTAAAAAAGAAAWVARYGATLEAVVVVAFIAVLAAVSAIDLESRRIPNVIVLPAAAGAFGAVAVFPPDKLAAAAVAAVGAFLFFFIPGVIAPRAVGMGDAKLALSIGAMLGADVVTALLVAALGAGLVALSLVALKGRKAFAFSIPFGPFLAAGAVVALVVGGGTLYS